METTAQVTLPNLQGADLVYATNLNYVAQYQKKSESLLAAAEKDGIKLTPETDKLFNDFLVSAKTCHTAMETARKPFTQKAQEFVSLFTAQENRLIKEIYPKIQAIRDASVSAYAKEEAERKRDEQLKLDQAKERVILLADAEQQIRSAYAEILSNDKNELLNAFENCDASTIESVAVSLESISPSFEDSQFVSIVTVISSKILSKEEIDQINIKAKDGKLEKIKPHYEQELRNYAAHLLSLLPERRAEIERGEESKAASELKKQVADASVQQQLMAEEIAEHKTGATIASIVIDQKIEEAKWQSEKPKAAAIENYIINVLKREGWAEIFKFYFTHSPETDLGKIKLDQMKAFAERKAKADNTKIESEYLEYEIKYKAQARKAS